MTVKLADGCAFHLGVTGVAGQLAEEGFGNRFELGQRLPSLYIESFDESRLTSSDDHEVFTDDE
jgi:hypothetical protein